MWLGFSFEFWVTFFLALLGIVVSVVLGLRRTQGCLEVGIIRSASLFSEVANDLPNLKVLYNDKQLDGELIWISGIIANSGDRDIGSTIIARYPILKLTGAGKWCEFSLGAVPEGLDASRTMIDETGVEVHWNILRRDETIPFVALISTNDRGCASELRAGKGLSVSARIENVTCKFEGQITKAYDQKPLRLFSWGVVVNVVFVIALALMIFESPIALPNIDRYIFAVAATVTSMFIVYWIFDFRERFRRYKYIQPNGRLLDAFWRRK